MHKNIFYLIAISLISTTAMASKSRLMALGEETGGSRYINDERNILLNPAYINVYRDFVSLEMGDTTSTDESAMQRAEGGVFRSKGKLAYGFYFGDEDSQINNARNVAAKKASGDTGALTDGDLYEQNTFSAFVGGSSGIPWGVSVKYGSHSNSTGLFTDTDEDGTVDAGEGFAGEFDSSTLALDAGVAVGGLEVYLNAALTDSAELTESSADFKYEGTGNSRLGILYDIKGSVYFLDYHVMSSALETVSTTYEDWTVSTTEAGWGTSQKVNDDAMLFYKVSYKNISQENFEFTDDLTISETTLTAGIAMEVALKDWLVIRGSVKQELYGVTETDNGTDKDEEGSTDTTTVATGAALTFGDFEIDGMIGSSDGSTTDTPNSFSRVSMTYKF